MNRLQYVLDANIFIEAAQRYYSFDYGMKFWDFLVEKASQNILCSVDKVLKELQKGKPNDPLRKWAESQFQPYFYSTENNQILECYADVIQIVAENEQYTQNAKDEFFQEHNADAWIIAYAKYKNLTVVTHESLNAQIKKKVLIPNVCQDLQISYINTFDMLRELNFKL